MDLVVRNRNRWKMANNGDGSMANMEDGEQRDGSVPEPEVHSRQDVERAHCDSCAGNVQHKLSSVAN